MTAHLICSVMVGLLWKFSLNNWCKRFIFVNSMTKCTVYSTLCGGEEQGVLMKVMRVTMYWLT